MCITRICGLKMIPWVWIVVILGGFLLPLGCTSVQKLRIVEEEASSYDLGLKTWKEGLDAFRNGDYDKALAIFEFLSESTESGIIYRKALYGLACTRLVQAQTADELDEAISLWTCWSQNAESAGDDEDPRMLTPLLSRITLLGVAETDVLKVKQSQEKKVFKNPLVYKDAVVYKNLLQSKEKEMERLKSRLEAREREVRRLRHQIESLEAIHLKIQEKKKEVSSP